MAKTQSFTDFARPVAYADEATRGEFLQQTALWTFGGLAIAGATGTLWALVIAMTGGLLLNNLVMMGGIFGMFFVAQSVARKMVHGGQKTAGFVLGMAAQGVAMGWLLFIAVMVSADAFPDSAFGPFLLIGQAGGLTMLTVASMAVYLWTKPRDLSMVRSALSVMFVPMLVLMVISFVFPIGGMLGLGLSALFVLVSGAGLLYQLNQVIHTMPPRMHVEAGYEIALGMLVLFWNILVLFMRLQGRD